MGWEEDDKPAAADETTKDQDQGQQSADAEQAEAGRPDIHREPS
jgi:hypothetical protein